MSCLPITGSFDQVTNPSAIYTKLANPLRLQEPWPWQIRRLRQPIGFFFEDQRMGLSTLLWFLPIFWWAVMIIIPWWDEGFFANAKDASDNATTPLEYIGIYT